METKNPNIYKIIEQLTEKVPAFQKKKNSLNRFRTDHGKTGETLYTYGLKIHHNATTDTLFRQ